MANPKRTKGKARKKHDYHHGDLKKTLLNTALEMLKEMLPEDLSLRELARRAGVSAAAPYRHFQDKNHVLAAIIEEGYQLKYNYMLAGMQKAGNDPKKLYLACGLAYFRMGFENQEHFKLMLTSPVKPSPEYPDLQKTACACFELLARMIKFCQAHGVIGPGDSYQKAMNCWCMVNGFTVLYVEGRLNWLGVDHTNAEVALRSYLEQNLLGSQTALPKTTFAPFMKADTQETRGQLEGLALPGTEDLFSKKNRAAN